MFSIRSIFTAAVALATLASAIPLTPPSAGGLTNPAGSVSQVVPVGGVGSGVPSLSGLNPSVLDGAVPTKRTDAKSPGDLFKTCYSGIEPLVAEIEIIIKAKDFDHAKVTVIIKDIVVLLNDLIVDLKVTVAAKLSADVLLTIGGVVCTVAELGAVVFALLKLVIVILAIVLRLVIVVDVTLAGLLYSLGPLLYTILTLVVELVAGIDVVLYGLIDADIIADIKLLGCTQILALVGIKV
jgi:hypothetical protein